MRTLTSTALKILDAATHVLISHGYGGFSMRTVANEAGISVGNLTYHFPTKANLLHGVIRQGYGVFESRLTASMTTDHSPMETLRDAVRWVIEWGREEDMSRFQREAWALVFHDPVVARIIGEFYEKGNLAMQELFLEINPKASEEQLRKAVAAYALASEGTVILNSQLYDFFASCEEVIESTMAHILSILEVEEGEEAQ